MQHNSNNVMTAANAKSAKTRLNIPYDPAKEESRETIERKYKGVAARLLKLYTDDRAKKWGTVYGMVANTIKETWSTVSGFFTTRKAPVAPSKLTPEQITTFHDSLIKEIIYLTKYEDYIKLIDTLNTSADQAFQTSTYRCLRTDIYFAIIQLLQEAIQTLFPVEYAKDVDTYRRKYAQSKTDYTERFVSSREVIKVRAEREHALVQLVLLGDSSIHSKAFKPDRKLFNYLAPVDEKEIGKLKDFLTKQFQQEDNKRRVQIDPSELINTNIPMPVQRYFVRLLFNLAFEMKRMDDVVTNAMDDNELMKGNTSLYYKYLETKATNTTQVTHEPPDMNDLLKRDDSPEGSPEREFDDDTPSLSATPPTSNMVSSPPMMRSDIEASPQSLHASSAEVARDADPVPEEEANASPSGRRVSMN